MRRPLSVVKLGGSLARSPDLPKWLDRLAATGGRAVIVPGGGPFAEAVRELQDHWRFADDTAHHMAILAMEQFGRMLAGLDGRCVPAASRRAIQETCRSNRVPVWMPAGMTIGRSDIAESWEVTSDSLAAWLANDLAAVRLYLVKSVELPTGPIGVADMVRRELVDPAFPAMLARGAVPAACVGSTDHESVAQAIRDDVAPPADLRRAG